MVNTFFTDECPQQAALNLCDKHLRSQAKEQVQIIVQALLNRGAPPEAMPLTAKGTPHKGGYPHHPVVLWTQECTSNFFWAFSHAEKICAEYERVFGKAHASAAQLEALWSSIAFSEFMPAGQRTPFPRALNQSKGLNLDLLSDNFASVGAYRAFYNRDKARFAEWTKRTPPSWFVPSCAWCEEELPYHSIVNAPKRFKNERICRSCFDYSGGEPI